VENVSGKPKENFEDIQVVKYEKGGFFTPHHDACDGDETFCKRMNGHSGQRYMTFLIYLNEGETVFPNLGVSIKTQKGQTMEVIQWSWEQSGYVMYGYVLIKCIYNYK
jgi:hypothetical protein